MSENSNFEKEPKRASVRRDSSKTARAKRDLERQRQGAAKARVKSRRTHKM